MAKKRWIRSAFSLVEILVVIAILSTCLLPLFGLFSFGTRGTGKIADMNSAVNLATDLMEIIINKPHEEFLLPRNEEFSKGKFLCKLNIVPMNGLAEVVVSVSQGSASIKLVTMVFCE